MDSPDNRPNPATEAAVNALQEDVRFLRALLVGALLVLNILSLSLYVFLHNRTFDISGQAAETERAALEFRKNFDPIARAFWFQLTAYSQTNRDFAPIMEKYRQAITKEFPPAANKPAK